MNFKELQVQPEIVATLEKSNLIEPTEIQQKVIPLAKGGKDIIGISKTGSGKTLAFAIPILEKVVPQAGLQALILAPTRELVEQIKKEIIRFGQNLNLKVTAVYGGVSFEPQIQAMRISEILVATPGRCLDHLRQRNLNLRRVRILVLDEADKMVSMGFIEDVTEIIKETPRSRQTLLFGATISEEIDYLKRTQMNAPLQVEGQAYVAEDLLDQYYYDVEDREKFSLLVHLIKTEDPKLAIIFCSSRRTAEIVAKNLQMQRMEADVIHGGMSQPKRLRVIDGFHKGRPHLLVATEVAARGLDIKHVSHIFSYDIPINSEDYVHRIGRTARAGEKGKAISLLASRDYPLFQAILNRYRELEVKPAEKPVFVKVPFDTGRRSPRFSLGQSQRRFPERGKFSQERAPFARRNFSSEDRYRKGLGAPGWNKA